MNRSPSLRRSIVILLLFNILFSGFPSGPFSGVLGDKIGKIVDESYLNHTSPFSLPAAEAAAKTKTIVFFVGSVVSTTAVASGATTTFSFTISLPDMVPTSQPIRSAYVSYNAWINNTSGITASTFTLNKQGGTAQALTSPLLTGGTNEQQLAIRLNATAAMRTLVGNASGTYAMTLTANLTTATRIGENAELVVTYDYDPLAATQMNTVYQWAYSSSTQLSTTNVTSTAFNFNLPESSATTTFAVGASSTNQFWVEYRGFISTSTNVTATVGWNSETTSTATFTQTTQEFSFLLLSQPKTAGVSPSANNTFRMISSVANGISAPTAIAVATYSFNFSASATLKKTIQVLLMQSTSTASSATINTTTTINIPETSPSSTNAFLFGRLAFFTSSQPGINAFMTTSTCSVPATTAITLGTATTRNSGYLTAVWNITASSSVNAAGNWNICSSFTRSAAANIPGLALFLSYNYTNTMAAGSRFNTGVWFLGASHMAPTGTAFAAAGINASIANASATANYSWLDAEFDNNAAGTANQTTTIGIGAVTTNYNFIAGSTARRQGATFSATSSIGFSSNVTTTVQCSVACINDAVYNVFAQTDVISANLTQAHYHWRNNDGSESAATAAAAEDTATSTATSTIVRLRFEVSNAGDATSSAAFRIEYQKNATSGAWTQLATSTAGAADWQMATSSQVSDGTATTNIATSTGGTTDANVFFLAGEVVASSSRNQSANFTLSGTQFIETEFAVKPTANATTGVPYFFRVTNAGAALTTYSVYPNITIASGNSPPSVSGVALNHGGALTLTPNTTTSFDVNYTITDPNGCTDIQTTKTTSTALRLGVASSCAVPTPTTNNLNCYLYVTRATSTCSGTSINGTDTVQLYYFAQSTGNASASFPSDSWEAYVLATDVANATGSATSSAVNVNVLTAINVTTSSVNYGTLLPSTNTSSTNQTTIVQNVGNSSTSLQLSGTTLSNGANVISVSSQHYATSSFVFGGSEQLLSGTQTTVSGFTLTIPTTTTAVQGNIFWGLTVPTGNPTGTYNGTTTFTALFSQ